MQDMLSTESLFDLSQTVAKDIFSQCDYPWQVLPNIGEFILKLSRQLSKSEYKEIEPHVWASLDCEIAPSADIAGPAIIQEGTQIRHCAYIRGNAIIGKRCVVGNSTEIKNSILFNYVQIPHYNYIGDSILGYKCHFGAGSITSNVKSDKSMISVHTPQGNIDTGLKKFGAIVGDFSEIGCNAVLTPGSILYPGCTVYPLTMVRGVVPRNSILKNTGEVVLKK